MEKNYAEALQWYRKAAERGNAEAQFNIGAMYFNGQGVEKDYVEAYGYINLASKSLEPAVKARRKLEQKMSPKQLAEGRKRTEELRAQIKAP